MKTMTDISEYLKDFRENMKYVAKMFGRGVSDAELDSIVVKQSEAIQEVFERGLDIGTLIEHRVPVMGLKKDETRGWMYETPKGLFEIELVK